MQTTVSASVIAAGAPVPVTAPSHNVQDRVPLTVLSYDDFQKAGLSTIDRLKEALYMDGIFGIRGIPRYRELVEKYIDAAREFSKLPREVKEAYIPKSELQEWLGYDVAAEQFQRDDGTWVVDDSKNSYYALVPDHPNNKWPGKTENKYPCTVDLRTPYLEIGALMSKTGAEVLEKIGVLGHGARLPELAPHQVGRGLHYCNNENSDSNNSEWCGKHKDHGLFTALLPARYFDGNNQIPEPEEAGLYVKTTRNEKFRKVVSDDSDVMLFQVGEFLQMLDENQYQATAHLVKKAHGSIQRFTKALFFAAPDNFEIEVSPSFKADKRITEILKGKSRITYLQWHLASLEHYKAQKKKDTV